MEGLKEEGPAIAGLLDLLGGRLARAMAGLALDADEDGGGAALGFLEGGGELEAMSGEDPVVMVRRLDQGGAPLTSLLCTTGQQSRMATPTPRDAS